MATRYLQPLTATCTCHACGKPFKAARRHAKTCSNACRQWLYRELLRLDEMNGIYRRPR